MSFLESRLFPSPLSVVAVPSVNVLLVVEVNNADDMVRLIVEGPPPSIGGFGDAILEKL